MKDISITKYIGDRNNYIPNLDPDGICSYILLNKFIKGNIVGFTNSKDYVYLLNNLPHSATTVTYIDMFVSNPTIHSIDQHIITRSPKETRELKNKGTKLNPNLIFEQDLTDYRHKFPLSTFLFLLILLNEEYDFDINFHKKIGNSDLELGYFLLDIDGVLTNIMSYGDNVKAWLDKIKNECKVTNIVSKLYGYINQLPTLELKEISDKVRMYLKDNFNTESKDGGFKSINEDNVKNIERIILFYSNILFEEELEIPFNLAGMDVYKGDIGFTDTTLIDNIKTFSYAIVRANNNNVSYTTNLRKIN